MEARKKLLLWLAWTMIACTGRALDKPEIRNGYAITQWSTGDGLPQNSIESLCQTKDGYLWIGTRKGLARFDGLRFVNFTRKTRPDMVNDCCVSLMQDASGRLLIGTPTGLMSFWQGRFHAHDLEGRRGQPHGVWKIRPSSNGGSWLCSQIGLYILRNGELSKWTNQTEPTDFHGRDLLEMADGTIWLGNESGLWRKRHNEAQFSQVSVPGHAETLGEISSFLALDGKRFLAGNVHGLFQFNGEQLEKYWGRTNGHFINSVQIDSRSNIWAGSNIGLECFKPNGERLLFNSSNGLAADDVNSVYVTSTDDVWAGTVSGGLHRLRPTRFQNYTIADGMSHHSVHSICEGPDGIMWVAAARGLNAIGPHGITNWDMPIHSKFVDHLWNSFSSVFVDSMGQVWCGSRAGIVRLQRNGLEPMLMDEEFTTNIRTIYEDSKSNLWFCGQSLFALSGTNILRFGSSNNLPPINAIGALEDHQHRIWVGSRQQGLHRFEDGKFTRFRMSDGLSSDYILPALSDSDGTVWFISENGLTRFKNDTFVPIREAQGLLDSVILGLVEDNHGWFWMNSHHGVYRVRKADLNALADGKIDQVESIGYGLADGLLHPEASGENQPNSWKSKDGRLWFPNEGVSVIDPAVVHRESAPPIIHLEEILANTNLVQGCLGSGSSNKASYVFPPGGARVLEFHFTAIDLSLPEKALVKCRLLPAQSEWTDVGPARLQRYTNLKPGNYEFQVMARNSEGVWSPAAAAVAFCIKPFLFERRLFWAAVVLGTASLVYGGHSVRMRVSRVIHKLEFENQLASERARIAQDMHDDVGSSLTKIQMLTQLATVSADQPQLLQTNLQKISQTAQQVTQEMDEIVWAINPSNDTLESLAGYLSQYASEFCRAAGIRLHVELPERLPDLPIHAELRHGILLLIKESLNNAAKHGAPTAIQIHVKLENGQLDITVADDGKGFDSAALSGNGNGLRNLKRRAENLKGQIRWQTGPGRGTTVEIQIPLPGKSSVTGFRNC